MASKQDLINKVHSEAKEMELVTNKKETEWFVDTLFEMISEILTEEGNLKITNVGTFEVREREARKGTNPKTGEEIQIPASKTVGFKPAKAFKELVN